MSLLENAEWCWEDIRVVTGEMDATFRIFRDAVKKNQIRMTTTATDAQRCADELGAYLPTAKILDIRYQSAATQIEPQPKYYPDGVGMDSHMAAIEHDERINMAMGTPKAGIVANCGKHWIISNRANAERAVLYGWHLPATDGATWQGIKLHPSASDPTLRVIQPESNVHNLLHRDYSMTLLLLHGECYVNGKLMDTGDVLTDPDLCVLLCHDGRPLQWTRQPGVPEDDAVEDEPNVIDPHPEPPTIRQGDSGTWVASWQHILITDSYDLTPYGADGQFGALTTSTTKAWQRTEGLGADGVVGPLTWSRAFSERPTHDTVRERIFAPPSYPKHPAFAPVLASERDKAFGHMEYVAVPTPGNPESIRLTNDWDQKWITYVTIPQLVGVRGAPRDGKVPFHKEYAETLKDLFQAWEDAGLKDRVISWAGSWAPRFIRGSQKTLSNHAYGTAFDINSRQNWLGAQPSATGDKGSVFELVPIAIDHGFYWGGFFSRKDGMHFEVALRR